jgi:hypothetical protein
MAPAKGKRLSKARGAAGPASWALRDAGDGRVYYLNTSAPLDTEELDQLVAIDKPDALLSAAERARRAGRSVWVPHPAQVWQIAKEVSKNADGSVTVQPEKGSAVVVPASGALPAGHALCGAEARTVRMPLWNVSWSTIDWVEDDIIKVEYVGGVVGWRRADLGFSIGFA